MNARRKLTYLLAIVDLIVVSWAIAVIVDCL
ncbi:hypothetical protein AXL3_35 [Stenotrophomonas phage vB_SmaS-AXL_3]|uniref:Uncharacterized protein n=1 Tax=Stenotrophomonas phage vB_SmaS-AXL_3 TaxID=2740427 RepID=A0A7D5BKA4_9CAUD|nr:hypothetical protein PQE62_gp35 [Stenotrophomonas phage vB_SmaS-AXL_3]QKW95627.1 hypothetical protein AXL3_35 [Stenotrophomonas phage vB_SmaS-AXL_3]